jgi:tRNA (adenine22-N1)-methyltransferase
MDKLTDRLQLMANEIETGETMADIGTDHGFLPLYLWKNEISPHVIMCDISEPSLAKAKGAAGAYQFGKEMEFRAGNGLEVLEAGEVDAIVIAGMGGILIGNILSANPEKTRSFAKFILQPRNNAGHLRYWLISNGYEITKNQLVREGKFICEIITVKPAKEPENENLSLLEGLPARGSAYWDLPEDIIYAQPDLAAEFVSVRLGIDEKILAGLDKGNSVDEEQIKTVKMRIEYWRKLNEI